MKSVVNDEQVKSSDSFHNRRKSDYLDVVLRTTKDGFWVINYDGYILKVNESYCNMIGYTHDELLTMNIIDLDAVESKKDKEDRFKRIRTNEHELFVTKHKRKDGSLITVEVSATYINVDDGLIASFLRNVTERGQIIENLKDSVERFQTIFENNASAMAIISPDTTISMVNSEYCKLSGYTKSEIIGISWTKQVVPEDLERLKKYNKDRMNDPSSAPSSYEFSFICKNGEIRSALASVATLQNKNVIISFVDITSNKKSEEERKNLEKEKIILENTLLQADKMDSIGTLAGGIAHDFNNLLMGIQGCTSLILMDTESSDPNYEKLKKIEEQIMNGSSLTKQLLGFARGGYKEKKPLNLNEVIDSNVDMLSRTKKEITFIKDLQDDLHAIEADRGQMDQTIVNLLINSCQAMPVGGEIVIETSNIIMNSKDFVKMSVKDTGEGMDEKTKSKIFEPFFSTKQIGRGTGLGLAMVYGIVKDHGGIIEVKSNVGLGTLFNICFPVSTREVTKKVVHEETILKGTETILIVDDELLIVEVTKRLLQMIGYTVFVAGSGQEAVAIYMTKKSEIDLVILDMIMPGVSGKETFELLRDIDPKCKVIISSGYSADGLSALLEEKQCNGFLQKPFNIEQLSIKIREILDKNNTGE